MTPLRTIRFLIWALSAVHAAGIVPRVVLSSLDGRQNTGIPNVPAICKTTCDPVSGIIQAGCSPSQCCSPLFESGYFNCLKCVADADHITNFTAPQQLVDSLTVSCFNAGFTIPELTFPGQNPNRTLVTFSRPSASRPASTSSVSRISQTTISTVPTSAPPITGSQQTISEPSLSAQPSPSSNTASQHTAATSAGLLALVALAFRLT